MSQMNQEATQEEVDRESVRKTLESLLGPDIESILVTNHDTFNSRNYYSLMLNRTRMMLVENSDYQQKETLLTFASLELKVNGQIVSDEFFNDIKVKISKISTELVQKKAFIFEKKRKGNML
jgi:hypothetical protein